MSNKLLHMALDFTFTVGWAHWTLVQNNIILTSLTEKSHKDKFNECFPDPNIDLFAFDQCCPLL